MQVVESDVIGASAGVLAALQRTARPAANRDVAWIATASMTLDLCVLVHELLNSARGVVACIADAGWKRSGKLRLPQNMAKVRLNTSVTCENSTVG